MIEINEIFMACILIVTVFMCGVRRIRFLTKLLIIQSILISLVYFEEAITTGESHYYILVLITLLIKAILIPWIILRMVFVLRINRELEFHIDVYWSYIITLISITITYTMLQDLRNEMLNISIVIMVVGGLLMIGRKKAVTQMIGFLVLENGLLFFGSAIISLPIILEITILFEVLILALILGILLFHINKTFDNIELESLTILKEEKVAEIETGEN